MRIRFLVSLRAVIHQSCLYRFPSWQLQQKDGYTVACLIASRSPTCTVVLYPLGIQAHLEMRILNGAPPVSNSTTLAPLVVVCDRKNDRQSKDILASLLHYLYVWILLPFWRKVSSAVPVSRWKSYRSRLLTSKVGTSEVWRVSQLWNGSELSKTIDSVYVFQIDKGINVRHHCQFELTLGKFHFPIRRRWN